MTGVRAIAHPSLALIKYWGKIPGGINLPATPSLALTLGGLATTTTVTLADEDRFVLDGIEREDAKVAEFLDRIRRLSGFSGHVHIDSHNDFPTAAGLASSASGFAALAGALWALIRQEEPDPVQLSEWARLGSGSACRSVYGGWTTWDQGATEAQTLATADHWPEVRVILFVVSSAAKPLGSREAMNRTRDTSPYYPAWIEDAPRLYAEAKTHLLQKNWQGLGEAMRLSYLRMFASMFAARPPVVYWLPTSVALLHLAQELREQGLGVYETMDAGPQVKFFCRQSEVETVVQSVHERLGPLPYLVSSAGEGLRVQAWSG